MTTIQSIIAGSAAALLLMAGPVIWQARQIEAESAKVNSNGKEATAPASNTAATAGASTAPRAAVVAAAAAPKKPEHFMEELEELMTGEIVATFEQWADQSAWLEARRIGRMLNLPAAKEAELREYVKVGLAERMEKHRDDDTDEKHAGRSEYEAKLEAWYAENLTAEQNATRQKAEQARREALVERLAEESLHDLSTVIPLTEDQKTKLYNSAAAKAAQSLAEGNYGGMVSFGGTIAPAQPAGLEVTGADLIAQVLDPAQAELWEETREQDRVFTQEFPRRFADRTLAAIKERGLSGALMSLLKEAMSEEAPSEQ